MAIRHIIKTTIKNGKEVYSLRVYGQAYPKAKRAEVNGRAYSEKEVTAELKRLESECVKKSLMLTNRTPIFEKLLDEYAHHLEKGSPFLRRVEPTTARDSRRVIEMYGKHLLKRPIAEINQADIVDALSLMGQENLSYSRMKAFRGAMNGFMRWLIQNRKVPTSFSNPMDGLVLDREKHERVPPILNIEQMRYLLERAYALQHPYADLWTATYNCGGRAGEMKALLKSDIDFNRKCVVISKSYHQRLKVSKSTKTGKCREVDMNATLEATLKKMVATTEGPYVFPRLKEWMRGEQAKVLRAFCIGIGLPPISFHALRACWATHLISSGVEPAKVMVMAGWTELKTMQYYIRWSGIQARGANGVLDAFAPRQNTGEVVSIFGQQHG